MAQLFVTIFLSICGGGAGLAFLQFLITRHDEKKKNTLMKAIEDVKKEVDDLKTFVKRNQVLAARIRILTFSDEIRHKMRHSKEMFDQINEDIDLYRKYCDKNPDFKNNKAVMAIANIERVYAMCLEQNDFLE